MAANKVILNGETIIDLTADTVTEADVAQGKTFHSADGQMRTGTASATGGGITGHSIYSENDPKAEENTADYYYIDSNGNIRVSSNVGVTSPPSDVIMVQFKSKGTFRANVWYGTLFDTMTGQTYQLNGTLADSDINTSHVYQLLSDMSYSD